MLYDHYHQDIQLQKKECRRGDKRGEGVRLSFPSDKKMEENKVVNGEWRRHDEASLLSIFILFKGRKETGKSLSSNLR